MKLSRYKHFILAFIFPMVLISIPAFGQERILSYDSDIKIKKDGSMIVTETIRVRAEGKQIRRGIYRDFPTFYTNNVGFMRIVGFDVLGVKRDNKSESWHIKKIKSGVRVYIGKAHVTLRPGEYTYTLRYKTSHQIGFFDEHDELYWNVTGNGWSFAIDNVSAKVVLPSEVPKSDITIEGYTGKLGATGKAYVATVMDSSSKINVTRNLSKNEGLTLVMTWPKGVITQPDTQQNMVYFLKNNTSLLMALATLITVFTFLYRTWARVGQDLKPGVIFPHYDAPKGYSPAASRYISEMDYDDGVLTAAVINLAVKGYLTIKKENDDYVLTKTSSKQALAPGEKVLLENLFSEGEVLELDRKNRLLLNKATTAHQEALEKDYLDIYFLRNSGLMWRSALLVLVMFIATAVAGAKTGSSANALFLIPFAIIIILYIVFKLIMEAPSKKGRMLMDKLEGFKMYLEVAEQDDLNLRNPPEKTPELFERYLPFAIALGVEQAWSEQFTQVFASLKGSGTTNTYHPLWYDGSFKTSNLSTFTSDVSSSITSAISTASAAPSSSSGSGGGGSSGGGGGGGGGGGW